MMTLFTYTLAQTFDFRASVTTGTVRYKKLLFFVASLCSFHFAVTSGRN